MIIDKETVEKVANLARLELAEDERYEQDTGLYGQAK